MAVSLYLHRTLVLFRTDWMPWCFQPLPAQRHRLCFTLWPQATVPGSSSKKRNCLLFSCCQLRAIPFMPGAELGMEALPSPGCLSRGPMLRWSALCRCSPISSWVSYFCLALNNIPERMMERGKCLLRLTASEGSVHGGLALWDLVRTSQ